MNLQSGGIARHEAIAGGLQRPDRTGPDRTGRFQPPLPPVVRWRPHFHRNATKDVFAADVVRWCADPAAKFSPVSVGRA